MINIQKNSVLQLLCILFVACLPLTWASLAWGSAYRLITILLLALFLATVIYSMRIQIKQKEIVACWSVYILYIGLMIPAAVYVDTAVNAVIAMTLVYMMVFVFASACWTEKKRQTMDTVWILVGFVCAAMFLFGSQTKVGDYGERTTLVVLGTATDPNEFAGIFIIPAALCCFRMFRAKGATKKIMYLALILMQITSVLLSGSRGELIGVLLAIIVTILTLSGKNIGRIFVYFVFIAISASLIWQFILPIVPESVLQRFSLENLLESGGSHRADIWEAGLRAYSEGPLWRLFLGYGPQGLKVERTTMHNQLLQILVDYGLIGVGIFLLLLWKSFKIFWRKNRMYLGAYLGMLFLSMTLTMPASYKPLWVLMMMAFATVEENADQGNG